MSQINFVRSFLYPGRLTAISAGILAYHHGDAGTIALLVDPAGPFWRNRDLGSRSIPKRELDDHEDPEAGARREFAGEPGIELTGPLRPPAAQKPPALRTSP